MVHTVSNDGIRFNNLYFTCVSPGTSDAVREPNWSLTAGDGVAPDGTTVKWQMGDRVAPVWTRGTAYANGDLIKPTTWEIGQAMYRCVFAGTSGGAEPQWNPVDAGPTQDGPDDGGVVWVYENDPLQAAAFADFVPGSGGGLSGLTDSEVLFATGSSSIGTDARLYFNPSIGFSAQSPSNAGRVAVTESIGAELKYRNQGITVDVNGTHIIGFDGDYSPATPGAWSGSAPTKISDALNRIAAALSALGQRP